MHTIAHLNKYVLMFGLVIMHALMLNSQNTTISGYVSDRNTGEVLIGASILETISGKGCTSNNYGFYSLIIPNADSISIFVSYMGYNSIRQFFSGMQPIRKDFKLTPGVLLDSVLVSSYREIPIEHRPEMSVVSIPIKQVENLPAIGGESDILKAIQLMPGVRSGNEGSSDFYVRGGSPDQNLILLDDVPLYYVNHLGGFVSTFNSDAISSIKLIKGGFPARYGSRLSSILDVRMKDGNFKEFSGKGTIGMVASKISVEGPAKIDSSSYIVSFRRFMYDIISRPLTKWVFDGVELGYYFYDFNSKFNYRINESNRLYFSIYLGDDATLIRMKEKDDPATRVSKNKVKWGNKLAAIRWNHVFSPRLFSNTTITYTQYRHFLEQNHINKIGQQPKEFYNSFRSGINDLSAAMDFEFYVTPDYTMRFGTSTIIHRFTPGVTTYSQNTMGVKSDTIFGEYSLKAWETAIYAENEWSFRDLFHSNLGGRISTYIVNDTQFISFEPRLLMGLVLGHNLSLKGSWARMQQNVHLLTSGGMGIPLDLWVPATPIAKPSVSNQWAMGVAKSLKNNLWELSIEMYYKQMKHLIAYKEGAGYGGARMDWQDKIETDGKGLAYGIEFLLQKKVGKTSGWVGYTLSRTTREFSNLNLGNPFLFKYDRTHDISVVCVHKLNKKVNVSATWVFASGNAFTLAQGKYYLNNEKPRVPTEIHIYDGINTLRMRSYHKLDVSLNYEWDKNGKQRKLNFSIYNLYNRQNPYYYYFEDQPYYHNDPNESAGLRYKTVLKQQSFFPIIPSISYSFSF